MPSTRRFEQTLAQDTEVQGISYLSGFDVRLRFRPAAPGTGLVFVRVDLPGHPVVPARVSNVVRRARRTGLECGRVPVEMVEHVLAALAGLRIDNCRIEIDGPETPGCDGSALAFTNALLDAGIVTQDRRRAGLIIDRPITVREGAASLTAHPGEPDRLILTYNLDYGVMGPIGRQSRFIELSPTTFVSELAPSRTFLLSAEADALRAAGIGRRTSESDLLVFGPDGPIDNELRYPDECVRHKLLDMVGDLALAGADLFGHVVAHRSGHHLNAELVRQLLEAAAAGQAA